MVRFIFKTLAPETRQWINEAYGDDAVGATTREICCPVSGVSI